MAALPSSRRFGVAPVPTPRAVARGGGSRCCGGGHRLSSSVKRCVSNKQKDKLLRKLVQMYVNNASMINEDVTT